MASRPPRARPAAAAPAATTAAAAAAAGAVKASAAAAWPCGLQPQGAEGQACRLELSVVPNARRTGADGWHDGALRVRLAAPPVDGKANAVLLAWLADALGCPQRAVQLLRGESARRKQVLIALPPERVAAWLNALPPPT